MTGLEGLLAGRTLVKRYRIEQVIGRGGFAAVYRADDERLGRPVAVKVITLAAPDDATREHLRERFQREARAAASLPQHPNVVTVHDFGTDPELGLDFLVMEFLHGEDLATHLARNRKLPLESALRVLRDSVEGVAVGHREGLIHRDVKPGNIFLAEPHGDDPFRVCVLDFGIARVTAQDGSVTRITHTGIPLSPAYASPEQLRGERNLTAASDVFSLGVVGYQLLTGEKPLRADRTVEPADWVPERQIRDLNPNVPPAIETIVKRAMSFDAADRFPDARAMAEALDRAVARAPVGNLAAAAVPVPSPPVASADEDERTLLQSPPPLAPPSASRPLREPGPETPKRSPLATWGVLLLLAALATVAALWAITRGANEPDGAPAGAIFNDPADESSNSPERSKVPAVTGEIIETTPSVTPGAYTPGMTPFPGSPDPGAMPEPSPPSRPIEFPSESQSRPGVTLPGRPATEPGPTPPAQQPAAPPVAEPAPPSAQPSPPPAEAGPVLPGVPVEPAVGPAVPIPTPAPPDTAGALTPG